MSKLLICGDREYKNKRAIESAITRFNPSAIIAGGATGADTLAQEIAIKKKIDHHIYYADWSTLGKVAGPLRNQKMITDGKPDVVCAFHDRIKESKGTKNMINLCIGAKIPVYLVSNDGDVFSKIERPSDVGIGSTSEIKG